ncbi:MAG: hypothetical protein OXB84_07255 [Halobacteriovoraceae bacterium]|nr:hypothetical protein [Halobacteriovoraceae bacterium]
MDFLIKGEKDNLMVQIGRKWRYLRDLPELSGEEGRKLLFRLGQSWPYMPFFSPEKKLSLPRFMAKVSPDIPPDFLIFFPGSFNPWHAGHRFCVEYCQEKMPDAHIMVVPDRNPWKEDTPTDCLWRRFFDICTRLGDLTCSVYPGLWGTGKKNYTVDWLPLVRVKKKGLLMGEDSFLHLVKWKNAETLLLALNMILVVYRREKASDVRAMKKQLEERFDNLSIVLFDHNPHAGLSSSDIRDC